MAAGATGHPSVAIAVEPVGTVWVNLIRMVVLPLVVAAVIVGVAGLGGTARLSRLGVRAVLVFLGLGLLGVAAGLLVGHVALPLAPLSTDATAALRAAASSTPTDYGETARRIPGLGRFLVDLVPANPVAAAAEGALLPVIVFSVLFAAAAAALPDDKRAAITGLAEAVLAAVVQLIGWFMALAPVGVACLVAPVAARLGWEMLASVGVFIVVLVVGYALFTALVLAPVVRLAARVGVRHFAEAVMPAYAIGFSTTSSMAALPALLDAGVRGLRISRPVASFVLPLAAALNRPGSGFYQAVAALFVAHLYGVRLPAPQLAVLAGTMLLMTLSVAAIPRGTVLSLAPALLAVGLPLDSIGLLIGVDQVPDMFRTATNVAGHLTAAATVARMEGEEPGRREGRGTVEENR